MSRVLPILNAVGCLVLVGFIFLQWFGGQQLEKDLHESKSRAILEYNGRAEAEKRVAQLEGDIAGLKSALESLKTSADADAKALAEKTGEANALNTGFNQAQDQIKVWEEAVKTRDEKLKELNASLVSTRERLNEAVAKLKQAAAH